jgi:ribosome biogenesis GTPase
MKISMTVDGIVIRGHGQSYIVRSQGKDISCSIRGRLKFGKKSVTPVAVGDDVSIDISSDGTGVIESVAERRTMFFRPAKGNDNRRQIIAANLDGLAVVASIINPTLKTGLIDRFLISAEMGGLKPAIIINKIDLDKPRILNEIDRAYSAIGIPVFFVSALAGDGCSGLAEYLAGHRTILAGHSGVGKTALINWLIPGLHLREGDVSLHTDRGIHTTTMTELFELPQGGFICDSPGLKVLGFSDFSRDDLISYFPEMHNYLNNCRFAGCSHTCEPGCAVIRAVEKGEIARFRYQGYLTIRNSL